MPAWNNGRRKIVDYDDGVSHKSFQSRFTQFKKLVKCKKIYGIHTQS